MPASGKCRMNHTTLLRFDSLLCQTFHDQQDEEKGNKSNYSTLPFRRWNLPSNIGNRNIFGTRGATGHCNWQAIWVRFGIGGSVVVASVTKFSDSEMDPDEEKLNAQAPASSLVQAYSIADCDPPLTPWPIPEPIYSQKGTNPFVPPSKTHQNPIKFHRKEGPQPPIPIETFVNKGCTQFH